MKYLMIIFLTFSTITLIAQDRLNFQLEGSTMISVGKEEVSNVQYDRFTNVYYPSIKRYNSPTAGLELSMSYRMYKSLEVGLASSLHVIFNEEHPAWNAPRYNRVAIPLEALAAYKFKLHKNISIAPELRFGFIFQKTDLGPVDDTFVRSIRGGKSTAFAIRVALNKVKFKPYFRLGYRTHVDRTISNFGWTPSYDYEDVFEYKTARRALVLSLGIEL